MGDRKVTLTEAVFSGGQNEGIERSVLPLPQLAYVQNARMRKSGRWGKRWGFTQSTTANLGNGAGLARCMGPGFAIVDDICCKYNQTAQAFVAPSATAGATGVDNPRIPGAVSGWLPDASFFPAPTQSLFNQTSTACGSCFALGYLWTVVQYTDPFNNTDQMMRVVATDPNDQTLVFVSELRGLVIGNGGSRYPRLIAVGNTVVLTYLTTSAGPIYTVRGRALISLGGGFGTDTFINAGTTIAAYDAAPYSSTQFLVAGANGTTGVTVALYTTAFASVATATAADSSGQAVTSVSVVGSPTLGIFVGYGVPGTTSTKVRVYTPALASLTGTATLSSTSVSRPLMVVISGAVRCVYAPSYSTGGAGGAYGQYAIVDVSVSAVTGGSSIISRGSYPIALPFLVAGTVYLWAKTEIGPQGGYPTLLQLPNPAAVGVTTNFRLPIEMSVQDYLSPKNSAIDMAGLAPVVQLGTSADYAVTVPILYALPGTTTTGGLDFRVLQAKHYSDAPAARSVRSVAADSTYFVPMGTLTRVDDRGPIEEGFVHYPAIDTPSPATGGSMTPLGVYQYTAIFKSRNDSGRYEVSAPALPVSVTLGSTQGTCTVTVSTLRLTARRGTQIELYRTLNSAPTFYLVAVIDGAIGVSSTFVDTVADTALASQQALYTQVGQTLPNSFPPASRFGCAGASRLFLGGLMRPDVVQASKLIVGDQSPSFADSDAFRIVLPTACTGLAWMDSLVIFTAEGIYVASGDGPTDDGLGDFGNLSRLPFQLGCIEPRSVFTTGEGTFFQSARGLYLLPRGFGEPVPAGDTIMDTLAAYPVITGVAAVVKKTEQTIRWSCVDAACTVGVQIVYDLAHKCWSVDTLTDTAGTRQPQAVIGQWLASEIAMCSPDLNAGHLRLTTSTFADNGNSIAMLLRTGDVRPFGGIARGELQRCGVMAELRSACTMNVKLTGDSAIGSVVSRTFSLAGGDYAVGQDTYTEIALGAVPGRNITALQLEISELSATEGLAFVSLALEHTATEGMRTMPQRDRI